LAFFSSILQIQYYLSLPPNPSPSNQPYNINAE
jgi:hypothetical protein